MAGCGNDYKVIKKLGEGGFGQVFLIESKNNPSVKNAMKIMDVDEMDQQEADLAEQEIKLLSTLKHTHLLKYVECFQQAGKLCIVTEFCPNGDLNDYKEELRPNKLEERRLVEWFKQIASAVEYLHSKNIIHRDLKLQNVFLNAQMDCVLGDLGIARILESSTDFSQTVIGTLHYMSPEIFMGIPYSFKTDVWSLAVMMYELAALEKPFDANFEQRLIFLITCGQNPDMPEGYCSEFTDLLSKMMQKDPDDRLSSSQIMKHKLFQKKAKPKPMAERKSQEIGSDEYMDAESIAPFLSTFSSLSSKDHKNPKPKPKKKLPVLEEDEEEEPPEIAHVSRTLIGMGIFGPEKKYEKGRTGILRKQVDLLKLYCLHALDNDEALFEKASKELDRIDDSEELEEKLIRVLGHDKFGMCGMQLLHYKNYSFNLRNKK